MKVMQITDIDKTQKYEGYLWYSDKETPDVYEDKVLGEFIKTNGSFIVEGQLYDREHRKSYSIKYLGGNYLVNAFDVDDNDFNIEGIDKYYLSNKMGNRQLHFLQYWDEVKDDNCPGMKVLQPTRLVFVGFENAPKNKEGR
ncbi:MAG: TIGR04423 family type III CRISPR-associated protein [Bacteroidales bacterium]|nr:TIGR04423 family type III CRISPR-associated protein [Bacteroidales bacterium]